MTEVKTAFLIRMRYHPPTNYKGSRYSYAWPWTDGKAHRQFAPPIGNGGLFSQAEDAASELHRFLEAQIPSHPKRYIKEITYSEWTANSPDTFVMVRFEYY